MDEKLTPVTPMIPVAEPQYFIPPHPAAAAPLSVETVTPAEPIIAEDSISDLIQEAVSGLRMELGTEIQAAVQKERLKEVTFDAKN